MRATNSKITITTENDKIIFSTEKESRTLRYNEFHGKVSFYMDGPKGFLVLQDSPKLRRDKNILILDTGSGFYNIEFICIKPEEMMARIEELKKLLVDLYNGYTALVEATKNKPQKPFVNRKGKGFKVNKADFSAIQVPEDLEKLGDQLNESRFTKSLDEYITEIINMADNREIAKIVENHIRINPNFLEAIDAIKYYRSKTT